MPPKTALEARSVYAVALDTKECYFSRNLVPRRSSSRTGESPLGSEIQRDAGCRVWEQALELCSTTAPDNNVVLTGTSKCGRTC